MLAAFDVSHRRVKRDLLFGTDGDNTKVLYSDRDDECIIRMTIEIAGVALKVAEDRGLYFELMARKITLASFVTSICIAYMIELSIAATELSECSFC
jgi:hypothetical protein